MENNNLKYFELNNQILNDFDKVMSMHLDYVEELKVSEIDANSKLLNVVSLCINVKTIIIEGDQRVNTNAIISNICKPERLQNLTLTNVKLPNGHTLKKLTGLKNIFLKNIRFTNIGAFFRELPNPSQVENICIENTDFEKNSVEILEPYTNLRNFTFKNVSNCKLTNLEFLTKNKHMEKIIIQKEKIAIEEVNALLKGKMHKEVQCDLITKESFAIQDKFEITENDKVSFIINSVNLEKLIDKVNIYKIDKLSLILEKMDDLDVYIKPLKKIRGDISVLIKDVSQLTKEDAKKLEVRLKVGAVDILSFDKQTVANSYPIEDYILMRDMIEQLVNQIPKHVTEIQKFLDIYKLLAEEFTIDDAFEVTTENLNDLKSEMEQKICLSKDFAVILQNCLSCLKIDSCVIEGRLNHSGKMHTWNQVFLEGDWYNVDIALDAQRIQSKNFIKRTSHYCLQNDREFYETHMPLSDHRKYAEKSFDKKTLNVFFRTGIYSDKLLRSYFENIMSKIKILTFLNRQKALPSGNAVDTQENIEEENH